MANTLLKKVSVNIKLDDGTDSDGKQHTISIALGNLSKDNFDADKALAIINALEPCLTRDLVSVDMLQTSTITAAQG